MTIIDLLNEMRNYGGPARTSGLSDEVILRFANSDDQLSEAIENAHQMFMRLREDKPALLLMDEESQIREIQSGYVNFYADDGH